MHTAVHICNTNHFTHYVQNHEKQKTENQKKKHTKTGLLMDVAVIEFVSFNPFFTFICHALRVSIWDKNQKRRKPKDKKKQKHSLTE